MTKTKNDNSVPKQKPIAKIQVHQQELSVWTHDKMELARLHTLVNTFRRVAQNGRPRALPLRGGGLGPYFLENTSPPEPGQ